MAADEPQPSTSVPKSSDAEAYDASLDFFSENFNPLKALQAAHIVIPVPDARTYDNINKYESVTKCLSTEKHVKRDVAPNTKFERNFLPHQMPIKTQRKAQKSIGKWMDTQTQHQGPFTALKKCVDERIRIKVWTRHSHGIRGYCLAFVTAFDKHWNMALDDVTEIWTRTRKRKVPALSTVPVTEPRFSTRIVPPRIVITKVTKKIEHCERYVPQLLVRGEQVVFINLL